MESPGPSGLGRTTEAIARTFSNTPERLGVLMRSSPSLQPRTLPLYSPDTKGFSTPELRGPPTRDDRFSSVSSVPVQSQPDQGFQDHMDQHAREQLTKEWDTLFLGDGTDDIRSGPDVYRALRKDLRSMACALKESFGLVVDSCHYSSGTSRGGVQQLQPCIAELKSVAKEMAGATRMATDNYNLQVELTLQRHASQHLLAQLHEAQLARMALEEEIAVLREESQRAGQVTGQVGSQVAHLRQINQQLQDRALEAEGEIHEWTRQARRLEEELKAERARAAALEERLRELELFEDSGCQTPSGERRGSFDSCGSAGYSLAAVAAALGAVATPPGPSAACASSLTPAGASGHLHTVGSWGTAAGRAGGAYAGASGDGSGEASSAAHARHVHARVHELPPELRRLLGKLLRRRDAEAARLRESSELLQEEVARLRAELEAATAAAAAAADARQPQAPAEATNAANARRGSGAGDVVGAAAAGSAAPVDQRSCRVSSDSWNTDEDFEWATKPVTAGPHDGVQPQSQQKLDRQQTQVEDMQVERPAAAAAEAELEAARASICRLESDVSRLEGEVAEARQQLQAQQQAGAAAASELDAARRRLAQLEEEFNAAQRRCEQQQGASAAAEAELETVRASVSRLQSELVEAREQLQTQQQTAKTAAAELEASLLQQVRAAEAQGEARAKAAQQAQDLLEDARQRMQALQQEQQQLLLLQQQLQLQQQSPPRAEFSDEALSEAASVLTEQLSAERDALTAELREARREAAAAAEAASAEASFAAAAAASQSSRNAADLESAQQIIASLEAQLAAAASALAELKGRLTEAEARERHERQARDKAAKELETVRQRVTRLQADMREVRAEAQVAQFEATAASRDVMAANSEKLKAQREMEEAVERMRQAEAAQGALTVQLKEVEGERSRLAEKVSELEAAVEAAKAGSAVCAAVGALARVGSAETARDASSAAAETAESTASSTLVSELRLALEAAHAELSTVQRQLADERSGWQEAQSGARAELEALRVELTAIQAELSAVQTASAQRVASLEEQLSRANAATRAASQEQQQLRQKQQELLQLRERLAETHQRVVALEAQTETLRRSLAEAEAAAAQQRADSTRALQETDQRHTTELEQLRTRLAEASAAAAAAAAAAQHSTPSCNGDTSRDHSNGNSAESELVRTPYHNVVDDTEEGDGDDEDGDAVALRARCRALRGELLLVQSRLAAVVEVSEAAARGRLAEVLAEAQAAAAAGRVASDEEFWSRNNEMHSLHALVSALRSTSLLHGPTTMTSAAAAAAASGSGGIGSSYGDTAADGAGSLVGASASQQAALQRRRLLACVRLRCGQVAEVLSEARSLMQQSSSTAAAAAGSRGAVADEGLGRSFRGFSCSSDGGSPQTSGGGGWAAAAAAAVGAAGGPQLAHSVGSQQLGHAERSEDFDHRMGGISDGGFPSTAAASARTTSGGGGAGPASHSLFLNGGGPGAQPHHTSAGGMLLGPGPSSSFTSETTGSLANDDFADLSNLYEIPPMADPPKFDFSNLGLSDLAL